MKPSPQPFAVAFTTVERPCLVTDCAFAEYDRAESYGYHICQSLKNVTGFTIWHVPTNVPLLTVTINRWDVSAATIKTD